MRRAAYEKSGGHRRLRMDVIEDMKLGKLMKLAGFRSGVAVAQDMVNVRWHSGVQQRDSRRHEKHVCRVPLQSRCSPRRDSALRDHERAAVFRRRVRDGLGARVCRNRCGRAILIHGGNGLVDGRFPALRVNASARRAAVLLDARPLGNRDAVARRRRLARYILSTERTPQRDGLKVAHALACEVLVLAMTRSHLINASGGSQRTQAEPSRGNSLGSIPSE